MKQAGVMLVVKDGLILAISRRHNKNIFGLPGGKFDEGVDHSSMDTAIRETLEETSVKVNKCVQVFQRVELGDGANAVDFYSTTYYATDWEGEPQTSEEGEVKWLTAEELTATHAAFGDYNRNMLNSFKRMFPDVDLVGEMCPGGCNNTGWQTGDNEGFICDLCDRACICDGYRDPLCPIHQGCDN